MQSIAREYDELRLRLGPGAAGGHRVFASTGSAEVCGHCDLPLDEIEIDSLRIRAGVRTCRGARINSAVLCDAKRLGGQLFEALFHGKVGALYREALAAARNAGRGLRITLCLSEAPELIDVPWEYLFDAPDFLATSASTPVVRYLDLPRGPRPLVVQPPLRLLCVVSSPADYEQLDVDSERSNLEHALSALVQAGSVSVEWLVRPTLGDLFRALQTGAFHALHYVGHGSFDVSSESGFLMLEDDSGWANAVSGDKLAAILRDITSLRLAVLNACDGARNGRNDPFTGVAQALVQRDVPAVIAMQSEISDEAALVFAQGFYSALAGGVPVDAALAVARMTMFAERGDDVEWGTPALFMRVPDGRIFDVLEPAPAEQEGSARQSASHTDTTQTESAPRRPRLPVPAQALVGRQSELGCVEELLARGDVRLVTLLGPGGSGKTRLAMELATRLTQRYRDGVWFVPLAPLTDPALVAPEIARTLGVKETAGEPLALTLAAGIADREMLLVLDNFEHLIAAGGLVSRLLEAAGGLDVLVTSRQALSLGGEHRVEVPPLPLDDAVTLLVGRAAAVRRDIATDGKERGAAERICTRLDGLPLALELAAAHAALFSFSALEARLGQRLDLPAGTRDLPDRQRTLRGTLDWSYQLLSPAERRLYRGFARFSGGARLEAIEAIIEDLGAPVTEVVAALVDKSLLRRRDDADGLPRFWMLETVREHAWEEACAHGDAGPIARRHAQHFLDFAQDGDRGLATAEQGAWLARLQADHDNLRASYDHLFISRPAEALALVGALGRFWEIHGHLAEARQRLSRVLGETPATGAAGARATHLAGRLAYLEGNAAAAEPLFLDALRIARDAGEHRVQVLALSQLGRLARARDDVARSVALQEEALAVARTADDEWALMAAVGNLGAVLADIGDLERGIPLLKEALGLSRRLGETMAAMLGAANLAELALAARDHDDVESLITYALHGAREIGYDAMTGWVLSLKSLWALRRGKVSAANAYLREALTLMGGAYDAELAQIVLTVSATLAGERGDAALELSLWAALEHQTSTHQVPLSLLTQRLREERFAAAEAALDVAARDRAWAAGAELPPEDAFELAARAAAEAAPTNAAPALAPEAAGEPALTV